MWFFVLLVPVALFCQVSEAEDLQQLLGITNRELHERFQLVSKIEKLEIWHVLTAIQQERLRQAIILDKKPPADWRFRTYDNIIKPENDEFLKKLTYLEPHVRNFLMDALPSIPNEDSIETASGKSWWKELSTKQQMTLSRLILTETNIPHGWRSWKEAIQDEKLWEWITFNKDRLEYSGNISGNLQQILGITDSELQERLELFSKIRNLEFWSVLTAVQQERLRQAVILHKKPPAMWIRLSSYDKLLKPEHANFLWRLTHVETRLRNFFLSRLPSVPHEDVVRIASGKSWWTDLTSQEQKKVSLLILTEKKVPNGWENWREAVKDDKLQDWIKNNKNSIFG